MTDDVEKLRALVERAEREIATLKDARSAYTAGIQNYQRWVIEFEEASRRVMDAVEQVRWQRAKLALEQKNFDRSALSVCAWLIPALLFAAAGMML